VRSVGVRMLLFFLKKAGLGCHSYGTLCIDGRFVKGLTSFVRRYRSYGIAVEIFAMVNILEGMGKTAAGRLCYSKRA